MQVLVRDNNVDQALKALKKKMQREGIFREMKLRGHYEKPSERKAREKAEAIRRARKLARKKLQREGLLPMKPKPTTGPGASPPRAAPAGPARHARPGSAKQLCRFDRRGADPRRFFGAPGCYRFLRHDPVSNGQIRQSRALRQASPWRRRCWLAAFALAGCATHGQSAGFRRRQSRSTRPRNRI